MKVIDATDAILGRMATVVAKDLLRGEEVTIVNAEETVISGSKEDILRKFKQRRARKSLVNPARHGPFYPRMPEGIVRRAVRGMLPYRKARGREAYKRLKVYRGVPERFKDRRTWTVIDIPRVSKLRVPKYMKLKKLSMLLGADLK
jgi:ribosomal protein uL13